MILLTLFYIIEIIWRWPSTNDISLKILFLFLRKGQTSSLSLKKQFYFLANCTATSMSQYLVYANFLQHKTLLMYVGNFVENIKASEKFSSLYKHVFFLEKQFLLRMYVNFIYMKIKYYIQNLFIKFL